MEENAENNHAERQPKTASLRASSKTIAFLYDWDYEFSGVKSSEGKSLSSSLSKSDLNRRS